MDISNLSKIILMPHVSEKSVMIADNVKQQTFKVASSATKKDVKDAIEKLFEVDVVKVNILSASLTFNPLMRFKTNLTLYGDCLIYLLFAVTVCFSISSVPDVL